MLHWCLNMKLKKIICSPAIAAAISTILPFSTGYAQTFQDLGDLSGGSIYTSGASISTDGTTVVGQGNSTNGAEAFIWTLGSGISGLGDLAGGTFNSYAYGVNANGTVVVGTGRSASGTEAFRWTQATGMVGLGDLAGGSFASEARGLSSDGSVVVGGGSVATGIEAYRWTQATGMVGLGDLAGGLFASIALNTNADGSVIVGAGTTTGSLFNEAFRWTQATGMVGLGFLTGGNASIGYDVSADGNIVVGSSNGVNGTEAFRWTQASGMVGLGDLAGGTFNSSAYGINAGGNVVVGSGNGASGTEAFRWTQATGMESLTALLTSAGVDLTGYILISANDVDASGDIILGNGQFGGNSISYIANLATGGITTPDNLIQDLSSGLIPVQQTQQTTENFQEQTLFEAIHSADLFDENIMDAFDSTVPPSSIAPAAGGDDGKINTPRRKWAAYASGLSGIGKYDGADTDNVSLNGTTGLVAQIRKGWAIGVGIIGGQNKSDMPYDGQSTFKGTGGSMITSYKGESGLRLYGAAFATYLEVDTNRHYLNGAGIDASQGNTSGMGYGGALRAGWEFNISDIWSNTRVMPYGEVHLTRAELDGYTETGGAFPATFGKSNIDQTTTKLGAEVSYDITSDISLSSRLAWVHRLHESDEGILASTTGFTGTLNNAIEERNWAELNVGGNWKISPGTHLNAELSGRGSKISEQPSASLVIGVSTRF